MSAWALRVVARSRARALLTVLTVALGAPATPHADPAVTDSASIAAPESGATVTPADSAAVPAPAHRAADDALRGGLGFDGHPIREIEIVPLNVYEPVPAGRLAGFYRVANRLHIRTRRSTIRHQLLFGPGDRWTDARGRELARNLRALSFLNPVRIEPIPHGDSVAVQVVTRDLWTTSPEFNFESTGGRRYGAISFTEKNLAGFGKLLSFSWRHDPIGVSQYLSYQDPNLAGSRLRLAATAGNGADGASTRASIGLPFWSLDAPRTYGLSWMRNTSNVVLYERASQVASLNQRVEEAELWWGHSAWDRDSTIRRFTYSLLLRDKRLGPTIASGPVAPEFKGGEESVRLRRVSAEMRLWHPGFVERVGVDQMDMVEDFDLGASFALKAGYSTGWLGGEDEGYVRVQLNRGADTPFGFGWIHGSVSSRMRTTPRETLHQLDARWFHQSFGRQTVALAAYGVAGLQMERDFQLVVGGLNGLRAYPVQALAGRRLWRLNAEDRWKVGSIFGDFLTIGAVGFVDAARAWGPSSGGSEWFVDFGTGLRLTAPHWTLGRILRLDLAWPLLPTRDTRRQPVFSFGSSQAF